MIAGDLIRQAQKSGIELRLVGGKVKAIGPREVVAALIELLRQHRDALTQALQFELQEVLPAIPPDPPVNPQDWKELAAAYHTHHFNCPTCIAAGRGSIYGLRCGVGAALWLHYQNT